MIPLEHVHPILVHFPIVFVLCLAALDLVALLRGVRLEGRGAYAALSAGLAVLAGMVAVPTYFFGDAAYDIALDRGFPAGQLETHESLGTATAIILAAWALARAYAWWRRVPLAGARQRAVVAIEVLAAILIGVTGYYGGGLVYDLGVNVTAATTAAPTPPVRTN